MPLLGTLGTGLSTWMGKMSLIALIIGGLLLSLVGDQLIRDISIARSLFHG